jgi:hypothetical protein
MLTDDRSRGLGWSGQVKGCKQAAVGSGCVSLLLCTQQEWNLRAVTAQDYTASHHTVNGPSHAATYADAITGFLL